MLTEAIPPPCFPTAGGPRDPALSPGCGSRAGSPGNLLEQRELCKKFLPARQEDSGAAPAARTPRTPLGTRGSALGAAAPTRSRPRARALTLGGCAALARRGPARGPGSQGFAGARHGPLRRRPPAHAHGPKVLGAGARPLLLGRKGGRGLEKRTPPAGRSLPGCSPPPTATPASSDLKPGRETASRARGQQPSLGASLEGHSRGEGTGEQRGPKGREDETPLGRPATYLGIPPTRSKPAPAPPLPPREVSGARAEAACRPGGLTAGAAPQRPSPPPWVPARRRGGGSSACAPSAPSPPAQASGSPRGPLPSAAPPLRNTLPSVPPFHHIRTAGPRTPGPQPRGWGRHPGWRPHAPLSGSGGRSRRAGGEGLLPRLGSGPASGLVPDCPSVPRPGSTPSPLSRLLFPLQPQNTPNAGATSKEVETCKCGQCPTKGTPKCPTSLVE